MSNRQFHQPGHYTSPDSFRSGGLGVLIFMEAHRRILHGEFGRIPKAIQQWAFAEGGYCIDAPDVLPAGGCEFLELDPTDVPPEELDQFGYYGLPSQITVEREGSQ